MTPTPVGMRCPECSAQRTQVRTLRRRPSEPRVTIALIIVCAVLFLATNGFSGGSGKLWTTSASTGSTVHVGHDYWRLVTSGFLHAGLIHILFNMYLLWYWATCWSPRWAPARFAALYFTALLVGRFGALRRQPRSTDRRRVGRGLRAHGRGRGRAAGARASTRSDATSACSSC